MIVKAISILFSDPIVFFKKVRMALFPVPKSPVVKTNNGILFEYDFNFDQAIKLMYFGLYEPRTVKTINKFLKKDDIFIDIGANIGYISSIALGMVGKTGQVHSFEPVPRYFNKLKKLSEMNKDYRMTVNQCAAGEAKGSTKIAVTNLPNIGWNTIVPNFMPKETVGEFVDVPICRLDEYAAANSLNEISLIKIDTEGYEFPVMKGLDNYLKSASRKPSILCEIAPGAYPLLGYSLKQFSDYMKSHSYTATLVDIPGKPVEISELEGTTNVLFRVL
ncbi:MAG: FkbM family methyltransferase [Elusimicrobiota bacterium]